MDKAKAIRALMWWYSCDRRQALRYLESNSTEFNLIILDDYRRIADTKEEQLMSRVMWRDPLN